MTLRFFWRGDKMQVTEKINALRKIMGDSNIDAYIIVTDDYHGSEYVGDYFKEREYMSGFTGSAGTLLVMTDFVGLWTDGRYFLQAEEELAGTGIELMKSGEADCPSIEFFLYDKLKENSVVGFDGRTVNCNFFNRLKNRLDSKKITYAMDKDLVDAIWKDRPGMSSRKVWELDYEYTGMSRKDKIGHLFEIMDKNGADAMVLTALDEIAWLLNLRGDDIEYCPVFLSFMYISKKISVLYVNRSILSDDIISGLADDGIIIKDYESVYDNLAGISSEKIMIDPSSANCFIKENIAINSFAYETESPVELMKAIKNPIETENIESAHIKDGVAVTKFVRWLTENVKKGTVTEMSAAEKLDEFRKMGEGYLGQSFAPIVAYKEHGAIVHYEASKKTDVTMKPVGLCLIDTGGHYLQGTTDITRTVPLGKLTEEEKKAYTLVLMGHLRLAATVFKYGVTGGGLDIIAREPLWEYGMDFRHGTGHGVGYLLNVHEGPQRISWKNNDVVLDEGMVISDEPGYYETGKFGIRHENLLLVKADLPETEYGKMCYFKNLTYVPFDKEALLPELMTSRDIMLFNRYQKNVYERISPYLCDDDKKWLESYTKPIENFTF